MDYFFLVLKVGGWISLVLEVRVCMGIFLKGGGRRRPALQLPKKNAKALCTFELYKILKLIGQENVLEVI